VPACECGGSYLSNYVICALIAPSHGFVLVGHTIIRDLSVGLLPISAYSPAVFIDGPSMVAAAAVIRADHCLDPDRHRRTVTFSIR